ncbi:MAG: Nif3-like dinuclear metal center hexameric protein [Acidobacteria bacterium]|nr:Nif3-like dinuclear metal center hexameric protein [Acidobacteriota bacterium]
MKIILLLAVAAGMLQAAGLLTARQVIEEIRKQTGVQWRTQTVDTFKTGNPDTPVTGIATTFIASLDVLRRAAASGKNLIITHEPTFYNHLDQTAELEGDAVLAAKRAFLEKHRLVVWRFHDHWHMRKPDGILQGMTQALGWKKFLSSQDQRLYVIPETTVERLAAQLRRRFKARAIRVVGDPALKITKVGFAPGASGSVTHLKALGRDEVEVLLVGEGNEWQTAEYVRDAAAAGQRKAVILLGHVLSEEAGMEYCARWLKTFLSDLPIEFIPAGEPFWAAK